MWLFKCSEEKFGSPTAKIHGVDFVNGFAFVEKYHDYRFLKEDPDFQDVTPDEFRSIFNVPKKILVRVPGGIGDSLFSTPILDGIKLKYGPDCKIEMYGDKYSLDILLHNPNISKFHVQPKMFFDKFLPEYDDIFDLGCTIENNPDAEFENAYKVCSDIFDLNPPSLLPIVYITPEEQKEARRILSVMGTPQQELKIGFHLESTSTLRTFPKNKVNDLLEKVSKLGHVFMFSTNTNSMNRQNFTCSKCSVEDTISMHDMVSKIEFKCVNCSDNLIQLDKKPHNPRIHHVVGTNLRTTAAIINEMNLMVCIDSGLLHISAGLDKHIVALFSSFDGMLRTKYFPNCVTINTKYKCAPCHLNNVSACPPMIRGNLKEPPCADEFNNDEILKSIMYVVEQNGNDFASIHVNPPPPVRLERKTCNLCNSPNFDIICRKGNTAHARCLSCEGIFCLSPSPQNVYDEKDYHQIFFSKRIEEENLSIGRNLGEKFNGLLKSQGNRVLEIGCSNGRVLKGFYEAGWAPYGIEFSQAVVDSIKEPWKKNILVGSFEDIVQNHSQYEWNWPGRGLLKEVKVSDADPGSEGVLSDTKKVLRKEAFELVYAQHTFEHFDDPIKAFEGMLSFVAPKGYLVIIGPSASTMNKVGTGKNPHLNTSSCGEHSFIPGRKAMNMLASTFNMDIVEYSENNKTWCMFCVMKRK